MLVVSESKNSLLGIRGGDIMDVVNYGRGQKRVENEVGERYMV